MKRSTDFLLREVAGTQIIVPVGELAATFPGMITTNETGAFLWELLENEQTVESLTSALVSQYDVDEATARKDVEAFINKITPTGAII